MSLNWSCKKVKDFKTKIRGKRYSAVKEALIWATMAVGINEITKKNYKKFFGRLSAIEQIRGAYLSRGGKQALITLKEIESFIGLWTNACSFSASQFEKRLYG